MVKTIIIKAISEKIIRIIDNYYEYIGKDYVVNHIYLNNGLQENLTEVVNDLKRSGFIQLYDRNSKSSVELSIENIKNNYYDEYLNFFVAQKFFLKSDVIEVFDLKINIQVAGKRIQTFYTMVEEDRKTFNHEYITFLAENDDIFCSEEHHEKVAEMDSLFGLRYKTNNYHQSDQWRNPDEYRIHVSKIEKIFLTKFYKDVESIGTEHQHVFNGKQETLELDMRNPDLEIYKKMNTIDNCIEIEWE